MNTPLETAMVAARAWLVSDPDVETQHDLRALIRAVEAGGAVAEQRLIQRFTGRLEFGTAGIRGPLGFGPQAMNRVVVSQTSAGLARYLVSRDRRNAGQIRVLVGYDARKNSSIFARDTAEVLSGHGIQVLITPQHVPTPLVAFGVRHLSCDAAVMVTASHNPAQDNGYKVYFGGDDKGSQIVPPIDQEIERIIKLVSDTLSFDEIPRNPENVLSAPPTLVFDYIRATIASLAIGPIVSRPLCLVYTPMHGVGGDIFLQVLELAGFPSPVVVDKQFQADPTFPSVVFPNPEEKGTLDLSFEKARSVTADLIIAHDPDADRLAVALPDSLSSDGYTALTGNQVGAIFGWYIAQKAHTSGHAGTLANSLVSSPVLGKIANHFGFNHEETLTGFKYVSRVKNLIFGFEEALGYLVNPDVVRDKDGISAGLLMLSLAHTLASEGKTLWDYLHEIEGAVGAFASAQVTIRLSPDAAGSTVTNSLRERKVPAIGPRSVASLDDFSEGVGNLPKEDILRYYLDDGTRVIVRPSGTEPKVKVYIDTEGATSAEAQTRLMKVESDINELVSSL